jgi:hypothetical protein
VDSIGGAKILTARLPRDKEDGAVPGAVPSITADAIPLFHWAGVEPMAQPQEPAAPPPRRRWPFRNG